MIKFDLMTLKKKVRLSGKVSQSDLVEVIDVMCMIIENVEELQRNAKHEKKWYSIFGREL